MKTEILTARDLNKKAVPLCNHCGSQDVISEAFIQWNVRLQKWMILEQVDGNSCCNNCGKDCEIKWRLT